MRAKDEFKRLTESYGKVLREGHDGPIWDPLAREWHAARDASLQDQGWHAPPKESDGDEPDPAGERGYDPQYKEAAYGKMIELLKALEGLKTEYADHIDPTDGFFSMIDEIIGLAGTEGEEEDDDDHREEEDDNIDMEIDPNETLMSGKSYL